MKIMRLLGLGILAWGVGVALSCGQGEEEATHMSTTAPVSVTTRPLPDLKAIVKDVRAATLPEDDKSTPVGDIRKITLSSGLIIEDLRIGKGPEVGKNCKVDCVYTGWLDDGTIFDDSRPRGVPVSFSIGKGQVIKGWDEGIPGMKVGGIRRLTIPASLGYGEKKEDKIPPNSTLHFRIEVVKVGPSD